MVQYKSLCVFLVSLVFILSFASSEIISPLGGSYQLSDEVLFNISVDSSVSSVLYEGSIVSCDLSDGYCEFSYYADELGLVEGLNTVSFVIGNETQSVSFYYYKLFYINSPSNGECTNQDSILFNISVDSSVSSVLYEGSIVSCDLSDGYCEFSYYADELGLVEVLNTVSFTANDETKSVSICYDITNPQIFLNGGDVVLTVGDIYTEFATANDTLSEDLTANITVVSTPAFNTNVAGTYVLVYSVKDNAGNSAISVNRTVIVNAAEAPRSSGGGSGSCTTQWTTSEWSECIGGTQTRTVTYPTNYCTPRGDKPLTLRTCTTPVVNQTNTTELESTENQPNFVNTITGAVIGANAGRWSLAIVLFLILIGLAWWIVAAKKRRAEKPVKKSKK